MNISVHICFTLATGCAYALCIYMCICICICKKPAKIDFCRGWDPRPCASVNHRQTGWWIFTVHCAGCSIMLGFSLLDFVKVFVQRLNFFSNAASTIRRRHLDCWGCCCIVYIWPYVCELFGGHKCVTLLWCVLGIRIHKICSALCIFSYHQCTYWTCTRKLDHCSVLGW